MGFSMFLGQSSKGDLTRWPSMVNFEASLLVFIDTTGTFSIFRSKE